jgi:hypothetical protein
MNRILLSIILLSGLVFLMGIQSNPWFGVSLVSQSVFAISGLVGVIFFLRSKTKYRARRDVA